MTYEFDRAYWERHWNAESATTRGGELPVNPYLLAETADLRVGSALDAGCGTGNEALWLAQQGWQVTGADVAGTALAAAADRAETAGLARDIEWVQADLTTWEPGRTWELVVTSYAHPVTGQLAFYRHISSWVSPGGTLLIVGHLHGQHTGGHGGHHGSDGHPEHATATAAGITELFTGPDWHVEACYENTRTVAPGRRPGGTERHHRPPPPYLRRPRLPPLLLLLLRRAAPSGLLLVSGLPNMLTRGPWTRHHPVHAESAGGGHHALAVLSVSSDSVRATALFWPPTSIRPSPCDLK
ncbi:class I SAM-dependent methyltransferase [Phytoactinopolyspora limicola]|uniref:class I SAM-dependent methyltransferase n=1 Tax=Phytoactinopolyspora limicola TaxID=2715536 RepID=UPI001A9C579E|nr:class I SAM-dependent methyltransferase [Phytoactinopolyspora limicola]